VEYKNKVGTKARRRKQIISCEPSHSREKQLPKGRKRLCSAALAIATQAKGTHEQTDAAQQACRRTPGPAADTCVWGRKALIRRHTHDGHTILGDYCMGLDDPQCCLGTRPLDFSDPDHFCAGALYASDKRDRADAYSHLPNRVEIFHTLRHCDDTQRRKAPPPSAASPVLSHPP
jgi:hypothetical protein